MKTVRKVLVYVTQARRLLVLAHPFHPEAGLQVPGGTIRDGEDSRAAAAREIEEETGLADLLIGDLLGETEYRWRLPERDRLDHRFFFHATVAGSVAETWRHYETQAEDGSPPIAFDFSWWDLSGDPPPLVHGHGDLLTELRARLGL
jgi:8-oxo-dGTP pyrophosphatase MutT (NUDIX family)